MEAGTKAVIVYYSKDGNTKLGAKLLNDRVNGKVVELKETKPGTVLQAFFKKGSILAGTPWTELADAKKVYLLFPIWASKSVPAMNTFMKNAEFSGKDVTIVTFQASPEGKNSDKVHQYIADIIQKKNGSIRARSRYAFVGGGIGICADEASIKAQIDKIELN